ncbi:hypothetical protein SPAR74_2100 [Streptococcus pneumoniae GA41688]|nr:hypothetical protein SPAR74_2100 [Streptococcus pneumoniae GA41688]
MFFLQYFFFSIITLTFVFSSFFVEFLQFLSEFKRLRKMPHSKNFEK